MTSLLYSCRLCLWGLVLGVVALWAGDTEAVWAQDAAGAEVVVSRFLVDIEGLESDYPDEAKARGRLPLARHGTQNVRLAKEALDTLRNPEGSRVKAALDSMYVVVEQGLVSLGLRPLPTDTLRGAVPYLIGYPMGSARTVVREGTYARAIDVEIDVTVPDQGTGYVAVVGTGRSTTTGRPELILRVRFVNADGTEWREKVRVRSKEKVRLDERWLLGIRTDTRVSDASLLPGLTRQAMERLLQERITETG
jgi:hypothetical protein